MGKQKRRRLREQLRKQGHMSLGLRWLLCGLLCMGVLCAPYAMTQVEARSSMYRDMDRYERKRRKAKQKRAVRRANRAMLQFLDHRMGQWNAVRRHRKMPFSVKRQWWKMLRSLQRQVRWLPIRSMRRYQRMLGASWRQDRRRYRRIPRSLYRQVRWMRRKLKRQVRKVRRQRKRRLRQRRLAVLRRNRRIRRKRRIRRLRRVKRVRRIKRRHRLARISFPRSRSRRVMPSKRWRRKRRSRRWRKRRTLRKRRARRRRKRRRWAFLYRKARKNGLLRRFNRRYRRLRRSRDIRHRASRHLRVMYPDIRLKMPLPGRRIGSGFGYRKGPFSGRVGFHRAVDIAAPKGTKIYAAASGRVTSARRRGSCGNAIFILHEKRRKLGTGYCHLSRMLVRKGQFVKRGQLIGFVGSTGNSTQPHLHFIVQIHGRSVDPEYFIR